MTNRRFIIILSAILVVLAVAGTVFFLMNRIPMNDESVIGNTPGNLYNNGLFMEMDGRVYFSNPLGQDCLYSMNPDETDITPITMMSVRNITGAGKYLYFYMDNTKNAAESNISGLGRVSTYYGLYRSELDGQEQELLSWDYISHIQLVGSNIYYTITSGPNTGLNSICIDGRNKKLVSEEQIDPACAENGIIYYNGVDLDHNLHSMDTLDDNAARTVFSANLWNPIVKDGWVYYMDCAHHYRLTRTNLSTNENQILTESRIDYYNMNDYNIFYATSESGNQTLRVMGLDGSNNTIIAQGVFHSLNLTSKYLYFKPFGIDNVMYHVPVDGSEPWSTFITYQK